MRLLISSDTSRQAVVHDVDPETRVRDIATNILNVDEDVDVVIVDADDPLHPDRTLAELEIREHTEITVVRRRQVEAVVTFNNLEHDEDFPPQTAMRRVYDWAAGPDAFDLAPDQRADHELVPRGETKPVDPRLPLAAYVDHRHQTHFHLRRKKGFQG